MTITFGTQGKAAGELAELQPGDRIVLLMKDEGLSSVATREGVPMGPVRTACIPARRRSGACIAGALR